MKAVRRKVITHLAAYTDDAKKIESRIYKTVEKSKYIETIYQLTGLYEQQRQLKDVKTEIANISGDCKEIISDAFDDAFDGIVDSLATGNIFDTCIFKDSRMKKMESVTVSSSMQESEFPCKKQKCRSKNTYSIQSQTRGGDEGMTTFVICKDCGSRYRFC